MTTKVKSLAEFVKVKTELEKILDSEVITTEDLANLLKFATQPNESVRKYKALPLLQDVSEIIYGGIETLDFLKSERIKKIELDSEGIPARLAIDDTKSQFKKFKRILVQTEKVLTGNGLGNKLNMMQNCFQICPSYRTIQCWSYISCHIKFFLENSFTDKNLQF